MGAPVVQRSPRQVISDLDQTRAFLASAGALDPEIVAGLDADVEAMQRIAARNREAALHALYEQRCGSSLLRLLSARR